jgi:porphyrinogen peroxidase
MDTPQAGIFALGTSSHAYLEFDLLDAKKGKGFVSTISAIREPRTTDHHRRSELRHRLSA